MTLNLVHLHVLFSGNANPRSSIFYYTIFSYTNGIHRANSTIILIFLHSETETTTIYLYISSNPASGISGIRVRNPSWISGCRLGCKIGFDVIYIVFVLKKPQNKM